MAIFILVCFVLCSSFTLFWLSCPCLGILSNIMAKYSKFIHNHKRNRNDWVNASKVEQFVDEESENIYYNNRDIKLLLDLLATCSGIEHSLRILVLFDSNMKSCFSPGDLKFCNEKYHTYIPHMFFPCIMIVPLVDLLVRKQPAWSESVYPITGGGIRLI